MAEADPAAGDPNAPREVETEAPAEQQSKVRPAPAAATDRGWWDETAAEVRLPPDVRLPPVPVLPGAPPSGASSAPLPTAPRPSMPVLSGRTPTDAGAVSSRPIPTVDPRPITAADLEDETRPPILASLAASRPTSAWLSLGLVAVGVAFVVGLLLGRHATAAKSIAVVAPSAPPPAQQPAAPSSGSASPVATAAIAAAAASADSAPPPSSAAPADSAGFPAAAATADTTKSSPAKPALEGFNAKAARTNLSVAVARAQHCRDATAPAGSVAAVVTFVPSGRVADVTVITAAYAGTHTGKCIISKLKTAQVPPYSGDPESMKKTFVLK
jgi:hypothetical protein